MLDPSQSLNDLQNFHVYPLLFPFKLRRHCEAPCRIALSSGVQLTQTPREISAPASAKAFAMAHPKPWKAFQDLCLGLQAVSKLQEGCDCQQLLRVILKF